MKFIKDTTSSTAGAYLDLEGLKFPDDGFDYEPLLHFNTDTYVNLKPSATEEQFNHTFYYPNLFLETLTDAEKMQFASNLVVMHSYIIENINPQVIDLNSHDPTVIRENDLIMYRLEKKLAETVAALDSPNSLNLYERLFWFCNENIVLVEPDNIGELPQHSRAKTFYIADLRILVTMFVICKLFAVIASAFIDRCKVIDLDRSLIDIHCYAIFRNILVHDDVRERLYNRLVNYITDVIVKAMDANKEGISANCIYNGDTLDSIIDKAMAVLFTRKGVTVDLGKEKSSLMTYIVSSIKNAAQTYHNGSKDKTRIQYRKIPKDGDSRGEENNDSILEVESANTKNTADTDMIISFAVQDIVNRYSNGYGFDRDTVESAISYYTTINHISLGITNSYILSILFGNDLMGSKSIELLTGRDLAALVTIAQLYFITNGYNELVHLLSLSPTAAMKATLTGAESRLRSAYMNNPAYRVCAERFTFNIAGVTWCTSLTELVSTLTTNKYVINTANAIWCAMDQDSVNGTEYIAPDNLGEVICKFILDCTDSEGQRDGIIHI